VAVGLLLLDPPVAHAPNAILGRRRRRALGLAVGRSRYLQTACRHAHQPLNGEASHLGAAVAPGRDRDRHANSAALDAELGERAFPRVVDDQLFGARPEDWEVVRVVESAEQPPSTVRVSVRTACEARKGSTSVFAVPKRVRNIHLASRFFRANLPRIRGYDHQYTEAFLGELLRVGVASHAGSQGDE
jgi:hypothetical protein